jgi:hypothetical protein
MPEQRFRMIADYNSSRRTILLSLFDSGDAEWSILLTFGPEKIMRGWEVGK